LGFGLSRQQQQRAKNPTMKSYILRNKITGLFLNETNFSEGNVNKAKRITGEISEVGIKAIWGANVEVIEITAEQIAKLDLSDELESHTEALVSLTMDARSTEKLLRERAAKCNKTASGICRKKRLLSEARRCASIALGFEMQAQR
jgi:hypothetical protein